MVEAERSGGYAQSTVDDTVTPSVTSLLTATVDPVLERFLDHMREAKTFFDTVNPYAHQPLKPYLDKADRFLRQHAGISYEELLRQVNPNTLEGGYYDLLSKDSLKRRLFNYRARVYLSALDLCEEEGLDVKRIMTEVRTIRLPIIKKEEREPAFEMIFNLLNK